MSKPKKILIAAACLFLGIAVISAAFFLSGVIIATVFSAALIIIGCLAFATVLIIGAVALKTLRFKRYKKAVSDLPKNFTVTAHTGCCGTKQNSLDSINAAIKHGADTVEFDLNFAADGSPVLSHDKPNGGEVTLEEAFEKLSHYPDLGINVDVKSTAHLEKVKALADKYNVTKQMFYTGIYEKDVADVRRKTPEIPYYLNLKVEENQNRAYLESLVKKVRECGAIGINFNKKNASKKLVDYFHKNGLLVSIWTADSTWEIYRLLSYAPNNITTKRPDRLYSITKERMQ